MSGLAHELRALISNQHSITSTNVLRLDGTPSFGDRHPWSVREILGDLSVYGSLKGPCRVSPTWTRGKLG